MNNKELLANTINELGSFANLSANECERFGMTWGCREDCPVLSRGECKIYSSAEELLNDEDNAIDEMLEDIKLIEKYD